MLLLGIYIWLAYREVESSARLATSARLHRAGAELASSVTRSVPLRQATFERVAARPAVREALTLGRSLPAADSALAALRVGSERPSRAILLLDPAHRVIAQFGDTMPTGARRQLPRALRDAAESRRKVVNGEFFTDRERAFFWSTFAIRDNAQLRGYLAQLRSVGTAGAQNPLPRLIGEETVILFANRNDSDAPWVRLDGSLVNRPDVVRGRDDLQMHQRNGAAFLAEVIPVDSTPWSIVLEAPEAAAKASAFAFLRRTGLVALVLILAGTLIAWLVSRRFTRPMRELAAAAEGIAAGDYSERVQTSRADELGALALAFNHMATQVQRSVSETEASRAEAEMANRVKSEFLANMSHEIRTPINAMLGYADLMDLGIAGPITEEQHMQLERIRVSGRHLTSLIDDLLDFARVETGRLMVRAAAASALDAARTALTVVQPQAIAKSVELTAHCSEDVGYLGDPQRVEQILVNLLGNAIKFTGSGGKVTLTCESALVEGAARTNFVVQDTGVGIEPDRLDSIFEAFVQGHSGYTRPHGGSGLGLTISRRLAHLMGGDIEVESTVDVGSTFTLVLPAPAQTPASV